MRDLKKYLLVLLYLTAFQQVLAQRHLNLEQDDNYFRLFPFRIHKVIDLTNNQDTIGFLTNKAQQIEYLFFKNGTTSYLSQFFNNTLSQKSLLSFLFVIKDFQIKQYQHKENASLVLRVEIYFEQQENVDLVFRSQVFEEIDPYRIDDELYGYIYQIFYELEHHIRIKYPDKVKESLLAINSDAQKETIKKFKTWNTTSIGYQLGGLSIIGLEKEFTIYEQIGVHAGAGVFGYGGGFRYYFKPKATSNFLSFGFKDKGFGLINVFALEYGGRWRWINDFGLQYHFGIAPIIKIDDQFEERTYGLNDAPPVVLSFGLGFFW